MASDDDRSDDLGTHSPTPADSNTPSRYKAPTSEPVEQETTPERPVRPNQTFGTPIIAKSHNDRTMGEQMNKTVGQMKECFKKEMHGGVEKNYEALVDIVTQNLPFDPDNMLKLMRDPRTEFPKEISGSGGFHYHKNKTTGRWVGWPNTDRIRTEPQLCKYLNKIADRVRFVMDKNWVPGPDDLVFSAEFMDSGLKTTFTTSRKPDLVVIPRSRVSAGVKWEEIRSFVSLKVSARPKYEEREQLTEYGRLSFSTQCDRRFVIGLGFLHKTLTVYVIDRAGVVYSPEYNVDEHPQTFLRLVVGLLLMDRSQLGYDTSFSTEQGTRLIRIRGERYGIEKDIYVDHSVRGRGTVCLKAKCLEGENIGKVCVVKDAWVDRSRKTTEVEMLKFLKSKVTNIPELLFGEIMSTVDKDGKAVNDSTENFRGPSAEMEVRDHYRIVMTPYGEPLENFASLTELVSASLDIVEAIEALDKLGVLHRDISLYNIILVHDGDSGIRKGYLIDFDWAIHNNTVKGRVMPKGQRSGTIPFMSVAVLMNKTAHTAIYDAESVFYVLIWIAALYAGPRGTRRPKSADFDFKNSTFSQWCPEGKVDDRVLANIASVKRGVLTDENVFLDEVIQMLDKYFEPLHVCLCALRRIFFTPPKTVIQSLDIHNITTRNLHPVIAASTQSSNNEFFKDLKIILNGTKEAVREYEATMEEKNMIQPLPTTSTGNSALGNRTAQLLEQQYVVDHIPPVKMRDHMEGEDSKTKKGLSTNETPPQAHPALRRSSRIQSKSMKSASSQTSGKRSRTFTEEDSDDTIAVDESSEQRAKRVKGSKGPDTRKKSTRSKK